MIVSRSAIRRPVTVVMFFIGLAIIGVFAAFSIPVEEMPETESPYIGMSIDYEGTPRQIEQNITRPVEEVLSIMSGVDRMFSYSRTGGVRIGILLDMDQDSHGKRTEAKELVENIRHLLPDDLRRIQMNSWNDNASPVINMLIVAEGLSKKEAFDVLDIKVRAELERVPGVSSVSLYGIVPDNIRISLEPDRVAAYNLDFRDIERRLQAENFYVSAGTIESGRREYRVHPLGQYQTLDEIRSLPMNDSGLVLRDFAKVSLSPDDDNNRNRVNGVESLGVSVYKLPEANLVEVSRAVSKKMEQIRKDKVFDNTTFYPLDSQAETVITSLNNLRDSGLLGGLLSVIVLFLFLRQVNVSLLIAMTVPLSLCATLGVMYFAGMTLNTLSLVGLMLTVGLLVDNSVVVSEAISLRRRDSGTNPILAADKGTSEVGMAIVAGTLTTVIVFVPSFMTDNQTVATMQQNVATPLCTALIASLLIAQTLVPATMARMPLSKRERPHPIIDGIGRYYELVVRFTLTHRLVSFIGVACIAASGWFVYQQVEVNMNPSQESDRLEMRVRVSGSPEIEYIEDHIKKVENYLLENKTRFQIENVYISYDTDSGNITINLMRNSTLAPGIVQDMIMERLPELPNIRMYFTNSNRGFGGRGRRGGGESVGLGIRIVGDSTEELLDIGDDLVGLFERHPMLRNVQHDAESARIEVLISLRAEQAGSLGLNAQQVSESVAAGLGGSIMRRGFIEDGKELSILLEIEGREDADLETLKNYPIFIPAGGTVPLESIADINFDTTVKQIRRQNRETSVNLNFETRNNEPPEVAQAIVENTMANYDLPPGYRWELGEDFSFDFNMFQDMVVNFALAVIFIYMLMAALFESVLFPTSVIFAIGFSAVGALWTLFLTGTTLTSMALTGMLLLAGIVVNNGIVLLNRIIQLRSEGMDRMEAIVISGRHRLRPILMTVCTTTAGMLPLAVGEVRIGSTGPAYFPMARTLIGGLAFSTVITLIILPLIYVLMDDMKNASIGFWRETLRRATRIV